MQRTLSHLAIFSMLILGIAGSAYGQPSGFEKAEIQLQSAWARRAPMMADAQSGSKAERGNGAVYVTILNSGNAPDAVVAAGSDAADKVELHETYQMSGMMKMRPVARLEVPARGKIEMKPGGYHLMLLSLRRDLKPGQTLSVTLTLERAGAISTKAKVK